MTDHMPPEDAELYRRIDEIVHYMWDPIGISGAPQARDEYYSYLTAIYGRVQAGELSEILVYMRWAASEHMGLLFDEKKATQCARAMLEWKEYISENT